MDSESISEIEFLETPVSNFYENKHEILTIKPKNDFKNQMNWKLPCSKSHFIRWLLLAAQSNEKTIIKAPSDIGNDILSTEMGRGCEYPIFRVQPLQQSLAGSP